MYFLYTGRGVLAAGGVRYIRIRFEVDGLEVSEPENYFYANVSGVNMNVPMALQNAATMDPGSHNVTIRIFGYGHVNNQVSSNCLLVQTYIP